MLAELPKAKRFVQLGLSREQQQRLVTLVTVVEDLSHDLAKIPASAIFRTCAHGVDRADPDPAPHEDEGNLQHAYMRDG
jgi:hypothetical protein